MTPEARKRPVKQGRPRRGTAPRLTYVMQLRLTPDQAEELLAIVDEADDPAVTMSSMVRNIVGVWLINQRGLKGQELEAAIAELHELMEEDQ